jgi:hypothetical protein
MSPMQRAWLFAAVVAVAAISMGAHDAIPCLLKVYR